MGARELSTLTTLFFWVACSGGSTSGPQPVAVPTSTSKPAADPAAPQPSPHELTLEAMQQRLAEVCICRDPDCLVAVDAKYAESITDEARAAAAEDEITRERVAAVETEEKPCRDRASAATHASAPATEPGDHPLTARLERARSELCGCQNAACGDRSVKNLERLLQGATNDELSTLDRAQADRILALAEEARRCHAKLRGVK